MESAPGAPAWSGASPRGRLAAARSEKETNKKLMKNLNKQGTKIKQRTNKQTNKHGVVSHQGLLSCSKIGS